MPSDRSRTPLDMTDIGLDPVSQGKRSWSVSVNGEEVRFPIGSVHLRNESMGIDLKYAMRPEGHDGVTIHEPEGGGSITIPYLINPNDGKIYVGVVRQYRAGAGGVVDNVPRGFVDPGRTHDQTAVQEMREETGLDAVLSRFIQLGNGMNPNTAFFDTSRDASTGEPEGAAFYALPVRMDEVESFVDNDGTTAYRFRQSIREEAQGDQVAEGIVGSRFIPLEDAVRTSPDAYTSMAAGLLSAHLIGGGTLRLAGVVDPRQQ